MKNFSVTIAGLWGVYGVVFIDLINNVGTSFDASCVENVALNVLTLVGAGVAHFGRHKQGDINVLGVKKW
jgi:hypothetical protein